MNSLSPTVISLPWRPDAAEAWFAPLSHQPWAMLLHSGHADHPYSRFDILVADPVATLVTESELTRITRETVIESSGCPLSLLQQTLDELGLPADSHPDLPFQGGALGLFGYDLGRRFETLPQQAVDDISLPDMAVGLYDWAVIVDHHKQAVSLVCHGDAKARLAWLEAQRPPTRQTPFRLTSDWRANMTALEYDAKFRQVQAYLHSGDCYQVNLAQRFQAHYQGDEWQAFTRLNAQNRAPFSAFMRLEQGAILSLSPERFIHLAEGEIQTRPIKGTLPRLTDPDDDRQQAEKLAASPKDRAENLMIVDLMRNDIGRVAEPGSVRVPELFVVEPFPAVHHLVSTITARLPASHSACDLLRAAFPGGSITGAPKVRAMAIIDELEPQRRNAWCGSIGYISLCGTMDTSITIRTLTAFDGQLYCSAGGGIVADSESAAEYQETFDKVNRILQQLES